MKPIQRALGSAAVTEYLYALSACLLSIFAIYPLLSPGLPLTSDGALHLFRIVQLDELIHQGILYPRWAPDLWLGFGYPLFNFYSPLIYYVSEGFHLLGADFVASLKMTLISGLIATSLAMYLFAREIWGPKAALLAAALYTYTPHFLNELYWRGDYAQMLAFPLLPAILWAFYKVITRGQRRYLLIASLLYASLILTHNVTAMLFSPFLGLYLIVLLRGLKMPHRIWLVVLAFGIALGISAFFWLPALYDRRYVQLHELLTGYFDFHNHFLTLPELAQPSSSIDLRCANPPVTFNIGTMPLILSLLALLAGFTRSKFDRVQRLHHLLFAFFLGIAIFLTLPASSKIWEGLPLLALAQFPWRLLAISGLAASFLAASLIARLNDDRPWSRTFWATSIALLLTLTSSFVILYPPQPFVSYSQLSRNSLSEFELKSGAFGTSSAGEFLPRWVKSRPTSSPIVSQYHFDQVSSKVDRGALPQYVAVQTIEQRPTLEKIKVDAADNFGILFDIFYFPGWQAYVDDHPVPIKAYEPYGFITFDVPKGEHLVTLQFEDTPMRRLADLVSLLTIPATILLLLFIKPEEWRQGRESLKKSVSRGTPSSPISRTASLPIAILGLAIILLFLLKIIYVDDTLWFKKESGQGKVEGVAHPLHLNFGDQILLLGYDLDKETVAPGENLLLTMYWENTRPLDREYSAFMHILKEPGHTKIAQADNMHPGFVPTSRWPSGKYIRDVHKIAIPPHTTPGEYFIEVGLYDLATLQRLYVRDEGGGQGPNIVPLQAIKVTTER
ncbi:MAG: 6-pyruvoyl-tetrahydropterin synthase-related protein [Chloroflexi bacterium]|nr:6-pyruvoyl-tetrahydropterin synthase-related protein [Chloroflexota bacterium]MCL5074448.1 6-pyruvoyl-tetrahydropterin synthase-related protein [Chloroflexota bacterium]